MVVGRVASAFWMWTLCPEAIGVDEEGSGTCCFNKWGGTRQCAGYPDSAAGGRCRDKWQKKCSFNAQCNSVKPTPSPPLTCGGPLTTTTAAPTPSPPAIERNGDEIEADGAGGVGRRRRRSEPTPAPVPPAPQVDGDCESARRPRHGCCSGCPPMHNGKLCASTSNFHDQTKGPCGCGKEPPPVDHWALNNYTAALNAKSLDARHPFLTWCPSGCGGCYELCSTGGFTDGLPFQVDPNKCIVFKVANRCGDGYDPTHVYPEWCSNKMTWQECAEDPTACQQNGNTNKFGYAAHFDLQNLNGQIDGLGWGNNAEVTFEPVSCDRFDGPTWDCDCPSRPSVPGFELV